MKIKIRGWPLCVLVLAMQQLMTLVFFPADSHLHFPVRSVVSRPFQRKATCDSSDDIFSLYSQTFNFSLIYVVVVHENEDSRMTSVCPCFGFATADDSSSFFPADSHLHFPVYCVVSRPFQRKATRDSSDDIFSLYSHCVERKPLKIPFNSSPKTKSWGKTVVKSSLLCFDKKLADVCIFVLLCFDEKFGLAHARKGARMFQKQSQWRFFRLSVCYVLKYILFSLKKKSLPKIEMFNQNKIIEWLHQEHQMAAIV